MKLAQPVPCVSAPPPAELSHPAGVWDAAVPLESLKFAVQPGPRHKTEKNRTLSDQNKRRFWKAVCGFTRHPIAFCPVIYLNLMCSAHQIHPHQIQIRGPAPCLRSPCCSWSFPLRFERPRTWERMAMDAKWGQMEGFTEHRNSCSEENKNYKSLWGLPCSGFSLCCIVHLLLLPNVLFLFSIIKLAYPLFTAGLESSRIGLCTNKHTDKVVFLSEVSYWSSYNNSITEGNSRLSLIITHFLTHRVTQTHAKHLHYYHQHLDWSLFLQFCQRWHCGKRTRNMLKQLADIL